MADIVPTWFGVFLFDERQLVGEYPFPAKLSEIEARWSSRSEGRLVPEEEMLIKEHARVPLRSRDRRFLSRNVSMGGSAAAPELDPRKYGIDPAWRRELFLRLADQALRASWDPSIRIEESIRTLTDLESTVNLLAERLDEWNERDPSPDGASSELPAPEPEIQEARAQLLALKTAGESTRRAFEGAVEAAVSRRAPNLSALLGPILAARLISTAGGLSRLARFPSSTVQVLGAERAFFEHLRGRAPPPRHGLLFLHPRLHSAPRALRGRMARALAGKVSIAARLDAAGSPVRPEIAAAFEARARDIREQPPPGRSRRRTRR